MITTPPSACTAQWIRSMRGSSGAQLVRSGDHNYVIKYRKPSQSCRHLIAEWLGSRLFAAVGLAAAPTVVMDLGAHYPQPSLDGELIPVSGHVASLCPGEATRTAIYDFLPRDFYRFVVNYDDLLFAFATDIWLSNSENRQAVFYRPDSRERREYELWLIDHHGLFGGPGWDFGRTVAFNFDRTIYEGLGMCAWDPILDRIESLEDSTVRQIFESVPAMWVEDDGALDSLRQTVLDRRFQTRALLADAIESMRRPPVRHPPCSARLPMPTFDCLRLAL